MLRPHILIVDDGEAIRDVLRDVLSDEGYTVSVASDGVEALTACADQEPTVVLLDLAMPVMDGAEFLARYRAEFTAQARIVVMSAAVGGAGRARLLSADAFIEKPFLLTAMLDVVRDACVDRLD